MKKLSIVTILTLVIVINLSAAFLASALSPTDVESDSESLIILNSEEYDTRLRGDPYFIKNVEIVYNLLIIDVMYSGGCGDHEFDLLGSDAFMESFPVQTNILLTHNAHGDLCEAALSDSLSFDLTPLKITYINSYQTSSGIILLNLEDFQLQYAF